MKMFTKVTAMAAGLMFAGSASAITVTSTLDAPTIEAALINAGSGLIVNSISVSGQNDGAGGLSAGTYTNASNTYGIGPGVVISSGDVADYGDGSNTSTGFGSDTVFGVSATAAQQALLFPISGQTSHKDVTQIDINFDLDPGADTVFFNVTFGSDEYAEFQNGLFIDAFGLYVNGTNIASVAGSPVNVNHPFMGTVAGTELDGVLGSVDTNSPFGTPAPGTGPFFHTFSAFIGDGATNNTLTFIIADSVDAQLDSTAYISQLGGYPASTPATRCPRTDHCNP